MTKLNIELDQFVKGLKKSGFNNDQIAIVLMCLYVTNKREEVRE